MRLTNQDCLIREDYFVSNKVLTKLFGYSGENGAYLENTKIGILDHISVLNFAKFRLECVFKRQNTRRTSPLKFRIFCARIGSPGPIVSMLLLDFVIFNKMLWNFALHMRGLVV